ncbi:hypothetical protein GCM10009838_61980 [Catenulispora subtropica]|uniref:Uncharacterized protein n=1 Tax=Catenulispora subtropica TaxID=450798 RepID=A0ABP5E7Z4_9ACTN
MTTIVVTAEVRRVRARSAPAFQESVVVVGRWGGVKGGAVSCGGARAEREGEVIPTSRG